MKFTLSKKSINKLIVFAKEFLDLKNVREFCHVGFCSLAEGKLYVTMSDCFSFCNLILPVEHRDGDDLFGKFVIAIPSYKILAPFVTIESVAKVTKYCYNGMEVEFEHPYIRYDAPDFSSYFSPVIYSQYFDAELLSSSLKCFGKSIVRVDFCSNSKNPGLAITKESERAFVLPCRVESDISYIGG